MNIDREIDLPLKPYLLGDLETEEQQRLEQRLMIDSSALEELIWIEDELIDDYLEGALSGREKEKFESFFLSASERQQKLDFAKALKRYAAEHRPKEDTLFAWRNFRQAFWHPQSPVLRWALAASLILMIAGGSWSALQISRLRKALDQAGTRESQKQFIEMQDRNSELTLALQREQARLRQLEQDAASLKRDEKHSLASLLPGQLQSTLIAVTLAPGQLRDLGGIQRISIPAGTELVRFNLKMESQDYAQYQATLQRVDESKNSIQISPMSESGTQGQFLRLIVFANVLRPGDYVLKLSGKAAVGDFEDIASYYFRAIQK